MSNVRTVSLLDVNSGRVRSSLGRGDVDVPFAIRPGDRCAEKPCSSNIHRHRLRRVRNRNTTAGSRDRHAPARLALAALLPTHHVALLASQIHSTNDVAHEPIFTPRVGSSRTRSTSSRLRLAGKTPRVFCMSCSIASILTVCRAMIRCICAFSASSSLSRDRSLALMPAYFDRQRRIVIACTALRRASSSIDAPASYSARIWTICDSVNRLFRMGGFPVCLHRRKFTVIPGSDFRADPT